MSTKIYDGLIIERDMALQDLRDLARKARPKLDAHVESSLVLYLARCMVHSHDVALLGSEAAQEEGSAKKSPWSAAMDDMETAREQSAKGLRSAVSFDFEAAFFGIGGGKTLAMGFGGKEQRELFVKLAKAKEYGYWDNVDPLELPKGQWGQRRRDWEAALGKGMRDTPAEAGVVVKLVSTKYAQWWSPGASQIQEALSLAEFSVAARAEATARRVCRPIYMDRIRASTGKKSSSVAEVVEMVENWNEACLGAAKPMLDLAQSLLMDLPALDEASLRVDHGRIRKEGAALRSMVVDRLALIDVPGVPAQGAPKRKRAL